ncbi:MAG: hypothetical protein WAT09_14875 [Paracoccaceae bacterium]
MTPALEYVLPERLCAVEDRTLLPFLTSHRDMPVDICARQLRRLETPVLQILLAAAADRRARGVPFRLTGVSRAQAAQLAGLGVTAAMLSIVAGR